MNKFKHVKNVEKVSFKLNCYSWKNTQSGREVAATVRWMSAWAWRGVWGENEGGGSKPKPKTSL